jgi:cell division septation protein DedD
MDQELKQRMIGAGVIIALAVIFVPMLFDGDIDEKHNKNISIQIPEEANNGLEVKKFSLDKPVSEQVKLPAAEVELVQQNDQPALLPIEKTPVEIKPIETDSMAEVITQSDKDNEDEATNVVTKNEPVQVVETEKPLVTTTPKVESKPITAGVQQSFRVKLGSFSQQANAEKVRSSLLQKNIQAIVEFNPALKLYRVWSQQLYQTESSANEYVKAVNQLKLNIGTPKVIILSAGEVDQMAAQGQLGWVVQLGGFADKKNAIELRNKVNAAGFKSFVDVVTTSSGSDIYRLRVGPLMEKVDAETTLSTIKTKLKLDGLIKNHEFSQIVN